MYELNYEYILQQSNKRDSELVSALMEYDEPLPIELYHTFNENINIANFPLGVCSAIQAKHGKNWLLHGRLHEFNRPSESFEDCDNRLVKELLDKTGLPIFIQK